MVTRYEMEFEPPQWFTCAPNLGVTDLDHPSLTAPPDWPSRGTGIDARKAQEEVLESILILNLEGLLRERVRFLYRGGDSWAIQDITALDNLGRVHLFELKRDRVRPVVPEQLSTYLLGGLYSSADDVLDDMWRRNTRVLTTARWALYIAAALANSRTSNIGRLDVNRWHPLVTSGSRPPYTAAEWRRTFSGRDEEVLRLCTEAMIEKAKTRGVSGLTYESLLDWGSEARRDLSTSAPTRPRVRPTSSAVVWLVGRSFHGSVFENVRMWRRAGLDARCLKADARQSATTGQWMIRIQREAFPQREAALDAIAARQDVLEYDERARKLELRFYDTKAASDTATGDGGAPRGPRTRVVVRGWDAGERVIFPEVRDTAPGDRGPTKAST